MQITRCIKKETSIASYLRPLHPALSVVCKLRSILEGAGTQGEAILFKFGSRCTIKALLRLLKLWGPELLTCKLTQLRL